MRKLLLLLLALASPVAACPFCSGGPASLWQDIQEARAGALVRQVGPGRYKVLEGLKDEAVPVGKIVQAQPGDGRDFVLFTGTVPGSPYWTGTPFAADPAVLEFTRKALDLPADRATRLRFFFSYLGHQNLDLAESAYGEFAAAPYEEVVAFAPRLGRPRLRKLLTTASTPEAHKSIYFLMLGSFHRSEDLPLVEKALGQLQITSPQAAAMSCYLELKGVSGLELLEERFLAPSAISLSQRSALEAMRFHANQGGQMRTQVAAVFRRRLDDPELAPLVLRDLALWSDWTGLPQVVKLFDRAPSWSRVAIVRYLASCPRPEAKAALERFRKQEPQLVNLSAKPF